MPLFDNTAADAIYSGTQTLLTARDNAALQIKVLKRKLACRDEQLAEATEREEALSKRLHGANSFRARYDAMKPAAEELLGEEKFKQLKNQTHEVALVVHKKYTTKHQAERDAHKAQLEALEGACAKDVAKLKTEGAARAVDARALPCDPNHPWQAEAVAATKPNGKKGKADGAAAEAAAPPKKKKEGVPTAYNRFLADKAKKGQFNALVEAGTKTQKDWFGWMGEQWKAMDADDRQPYVDEISAIKAAKAQQQAATAAGGEQSADGAPAPHQDKSKAAVAEPAAKGKGRPVLAATAAAAPADAAAKKKKKPLADAFQLMQKGAEANAAAKSGSKNGKVAIDSDDEEAAVAVATTAGRGKGLGKGLGSKPKKSKFVLDEAEEDDDDDDDDDDNQ